MADPGPVAAAGQAGGPPAERGPAGSAQWYSVCAPEWLPLADGAARPAPVADLVQILPLGWRWHLGTGPPCAPRSGKPRDAIPRPVPRLSIANRSRPPKKGAARLRCGQARAGAEAAHCRRYPGIIVAVVSTRPICKTGRGRRWSSPNWRASFPACLIWACRIHGIVGAVGAGPVGLEGEDCAAAQGPATVSGLAPQMGSGTDLGLGE